MRKTSLKRY